MTISMVLYGRNDSYGYNLHKRAALSLNCMAEVLTDASDEILFVDYNTPDDFPTFPEAIQDTLTKRVREILRILRVRPRLHQRFKSKTHLVALEPIARNVAIRRSSPDNRWILSTNTDMIFVTRGIGSLSNIARDLAPGFYHAPRIEIPEVLWESLDRYAPTDVIATVREWGSTLHLNEIILGAEFILYDGPGDFQLLLRDDLFDNQGFHEEMLLGWHVDSNMAKRMYLKYGKVGDLGSKVYGYHCDHTRQVTPAHSHTRLQNDWRRFCNEVDRPDIPEQANIWGCINDSIEEVRLVANPASIYVQALCDAVGSPLTEPKVTKYTHETYNKADYDPRHMVPFLADMFASMPRNSNLAWYGAGMEMLSRFAAVWDKLGFTGNIFIDAELNKATDVADTLRPDITADTLDLADTFLFDFGGLPGSPDDLDRRKLSAKLIQRFVAMVHEEQRRLLAGLPPRRVIALNAINNQFERVISASVAAAATPCATHMRHGFVIPVKGKDDWLPLLHVGQAGKRTGAHLDSDPLGVGVIAYGPYKYLDGGLYRLTINAAWAPDGIGEGDRTEPCIVIEVHSGAEVFAVFSLSRLALRKPVHEFIFPLPSRPADLTSSIETRIISLSRVALSIRALTIEAIPESHKAEAAAAALLSPPFALKIANWLPYLSVGPLGRVEDTEIIAIAGPSDFAAFGPYWPLPGGHYELALQIEREAEPRPRGHMIRIDVLCGDEQLVAADFHFDEDSTDATIRLPFDVPGIPSEWRQIETRIWSSGEESFQLRLLSIQQVDRPDCRNLFPFTLAGEAGHRTGSGIRNEGQVGIVALSPTLRLKPGAYRLRLRLDVVSVDEASDGENAYAVALLKCGSKLLAIRQITAPKESVEEELVFEVPQHPHAGSSIEFNLQVTRVADIALRALSIEPADAAPQHGEPPVLAIRNWLPFLRRGKRAHVAEGSILVDSGAEEFVIYGPYWPLPPGRYEMSATVVPNLQIGQHGLVTAQIAANEGSHIFAESKWPIDKVATPAPIEFRLPFGLKADFSPAARSIETRIFAPGGISFRILSLAITAKSDVPETDWFPYLMAGEAGVHCGPEIRSRTDGSGYVACTPQMHITSGRYRASFDIETQAGARGKHAITLEAWSGSALIAIVTFGRDQLPAFDATNESSDTTLELRVRAVAPASFSIHGLTIEPVSDGARNEPALLISGAAGVSEGEQKLAIHAPRGLATYEAYWSIRPGDFELFVTLALTGKETNSLRTRLRPKALIKTILSLARVLHDGGVDIVLDGSRIGGNNGFTIPFPLRGSISLCVPFRVHATHVQAVSKLQTRVWGTGRRQFLVSSLSIKARSQKSNDT